jgi:tRNA dimethylallyltransferase
MKKALAIVGPTGIGKSRMAINLAKKYNGEIINADSRQVYRYMDIGTDKPIKEELSVIPHHLIDIINPDEDFSLAQYQQLAYRIVADIQNRNKLPISTGGTGLYIWAVIEGWKIPEVPPNPELRNDLEERAARGEEKELYQELVKVDPVSAKRIDSRNVRRIIRALEVYRTTNIPFSELQQKTPPPYDVLIIGLTMDRKELYRRIDSRVDRMVERGLVEEVQRLVDSGYSLNLTAMTGIGYRQIGMYLDSELNLQDAIEQIKFETHRFVRNQYNWFRLKDERIKWFDMQDKDVMLKIDTTVDKWVSS